MKRRGADGPPPSGGGPAGGFRDRSGSIASISTMSGSYFRHGAGGAGHERAGPTLGRLDENTTDSATLSLFKNAPYVMGRTRNEGQIRGGLAIIFI